MAQLIWNGTHYVAPYEDGRTLYVSEDTFNETALERAEILLVQEHPELKNDEDAFEKAKDTDEFRTIHRESRDYLSDPAMWDEQIGWGAWVKGEDEDA